MTTSSFATAAQVLRDRWPRTYTEPVLQRLWEDVKALPAEIFQRAVTEILYEHDSGRRMHPTPRAIATLTISYAAALPERRPTGQVTYVSAPLWAAFMSYTRDMLGGTVEEKIRALDRWAQVLWANGQEPTPALVALRERLERLRNEAT